MNGYTYNIVLSINVGYNELLSKSEIVKSSQTTYVTTIIKNNKNNKKKVKRVIGGHAYYEICKTIKPIKTRIYYINNTDIDISRTVQYYCKKFKSFSASVMMEHLIFLFDRAKGIQNQKFFQIQLRDRIIEKKKEFNVLKLSLEHELCTDNKTVDDKLYNTFLSHLADIEYTGIDLVECKNTDIYRDMDDMFNIINGATTDYSNFNAYDVDY